MANPTKSDNKDSTVMDKIRGIFSFGSQKALEETDSDINPFGSNINHA